MLSASAIINLVLERGDPADVTHAALVAASLEYLDACQRGRELGPVETISDVADACLGLESRLDEILQAWAPGEPGRANVHVVSLSLHEHAKRLGAVVCSAPVDAGDDYLLRLRPLPGTEQYAHRRFAQLQKAALRAHQFRCVCSLIPSTNPVPAPAR